MGILLSWLLLIGIFQFMPIDTEDNQVLAAAVPSGDNSLSSLSISPGTLSPAFQYNVVDYTASVGADVTSVEVSAQPSNETATIESVSGNTDLKEGENLVSIVVKAENGVAATYKIVVTRQAGGSTQDHDPADTQQPADATESADGGQQGITIDGHPFDLSPTVPADVVPADFTKTTVEYQGQQAEALSFDKAELTLVYLTTPSTDVKNMLAVYEEAGGNFYPFRKIQLDEVNYLIILNPPAEAGLPQGYEETTASLGEIGSVPAYSKPGDVPQADGVQAGNDGQAAAEGTQEGNEEGLPADGETVSGEAGFSIIYGISSFGNKGWYQYDSLESTFQRYVPTEAAEPDIEDNQDSEEGEEPGAEMQSLQKAYMDMEEQYNNQKDTSRKTTAVLVFIIAVLIVVAVNLLLRGKRGDADELTEEDYDELTEKVREQVKIARKSRREGVMSGPGKEEAGEDDLWPDDTVPKAILKQQTKIIPELGADIKPQKTSQTNSSLKADKKLNHRMEKGKEPKPDRMAGVKADRMAGAKSDRIAGAKSDRMAGAKADRKQEVWADKKQVRMPEPKAERIPEPGLGPDDDFEVIDLEDL